MGVEEGTSLYVFKITVIKITKFISYKILQEDVQKP